MPDYSARSSIALPADKCLSQMNMAVNLPSNNMYFIPGQSAGYQVPDVLDQNLAQAGNQQFRGLLGPVAILWDIENCPVPGEVRPEDVAGNIRMALGLHPMVNGAVTLLSAYGDFNNFPRRLREGCQKTGVNLIDVPNGRKDAADKAILVDMFLFALDNHPPSTIFFDFRRCRFFSCFAQTRATGLYSCSCYSIWSGCLFCTTQFWSICVGLAKFGSR